MVESMVRQRQFGSDLGLIHEMAVTGREIGANSSFYAALAHDKNLFRRVVEMVCPNPFKSALQSLKAAVEKGVKHEEGVYRFFDPGLSILTLCGIQLTERQSIDFPDWYSHYDWAKREDAPQERRIRLPVPGSRLKTFKEQAALLGPKEKVASARVILTFAVMYARANVYKLILEDKRCRCEEVIIHRGDGHATVELVDLTLLAISGENDERRDSYLGLASEILNQPA